MKTTIEISDALLMKAKQLAHDQGLTLRSLTEEGLRKVIEERSAREGFKVHPVTFSGNGLSKEFKGKSWNQIRDAAYDGHGS
ncbi:MAG: type II toxin-antitoxin system VapB family antitoxin [Verrucomicrobia bacterium]|nr:type II toxin-antitoxin system VapB family antitoxin [Verrucomicrobiota bacterium]